MNAPLSGSCPACGQPVATIWGNGYDWDFLFCACGWDRRLPSSTSANYREDGAPGPSGDQYCDDDDY